MAEFRSGCSDLEETLEELFQEVDHLRVDFADRVQELEQRRTQLEVEHERFCEEQETVGELTGKLAQYESDLVAAQSELSSLRDELTQERERGAATSTEQTSRLEQQIAELESQQELLTNDRQQVESQLETAQQELGRLASIEQELAEARQQLERAEDQMAAVQEQNGLATTMAAGGPGQADLESLDALQQEREALEAELELVRGRASELDEVVADQKQTFADERAELSTELKALRRLVEKQAEMLASGQQPVATGTPATPATVAPTGNRESDPVVSSVMAQFAKLQKDVAQRRRRRG